MLIIEQARETMVKQQVRAWDVSDEKVLHLMGNLPRESFVPTAYQELAYADAAIPIGDGQLMLPPKEVGRILQALAIQSNESVLQVGAESGYLTTLLAKQAQQVYVVSIEQTLLDEAAQKVANQACINVSFELGDASQGWTQHAPYQVIVLTGSVPQLSPKLCNNLAINGRIFAIIGNSPVMTATLLTKQADDQWQIMKLFETSWPRLPTVQEPSRFIF